MLWSRSWVVLSSGWHHTSAKMWTSFMNSLAIYKAQDNSGPGNLPLHCLVKALRSTKRIWLVLPWPDNYWRWASSLLAPVLWNVLPVEIQKTHQYWHATGSWKHTCLAQHFPDFWTWTSCCDCCFNWHAFLWIYLFYMLTMHALILWCSFILYCNYG